MEFLSRRARTIAPYTGGEQPSDRRYVKLNTNENPYPPSPRAMVAYREYDLDSLKLYPPLEMRALREAIAAAEGVRPENVFCGNGSDEVLALCFPAFFDADGAGAAFADVTYSFYPVFCEFFGIPHTIVPLEEDFTQDLSKLTAARAQGVLVANPNAPTGIGIPLGQIEPFVAANAGRVVILDEAYMPFFGQSAVPLTEKYENLLVVKTFSKGYSLAGIRCGYAIGSRSRSRGWSAAATALIPIRSTASARRYVPLPSRTGPIMPKRRRASWPNARGSPVRWKIWALLCCPLLPIFSLCAMPSGAGRKFMQACAKGGCSSAISKNRAFPHITALRSGLPPKMTRCSPPCAIFWGSDPAAAFRRATVRKKHICR